MTHLQAPTTATVALSTVPAGSQVRIHAFTTNGNTMRRLADLGLTVGATAGVVQTSAGGVVLAARGGRLALGRPLAAAVVVEVESAAPAA